MEEKREIICSNCQRTFLADSTVESGFCLHCGTPFQLQPEPEPEPMEENCASAADRVRQVYDGYIRDMEELIRKKPRSIFESLIGQNSFGNDALHAECREKLQQSIMTLRAVAERAQGENHCAEIAGMLLLKKKAPESALYWPLVACEQMAEPLLDKIPLEQLTEIYTEYSQLNPGNQSLPNQIQLKKKMADVILEMGGDPPRFSLFSRKPKRK